MPVKATEITPSLKTIEAREWRLSEMRWIFAKTEVEPFIKKASNDPTALGLLPNHEFLIRNPAHALCIVKCRKTAHSWGIALKALARAITEEKSTTIIGSYDEDEAREKLNFLDWQYGVLRPGVRRGLSMSDGSEIRKFGNGSRIKFISRKAPTGAGASIEWDEFSVEAQGRVTAAEILTAALGCTTHTGTVSIGGTQRGPDTLFNQIVTGKIEDAMQDDPLFASLPGKMWVVGLFPWWVSPALCKDVKAAQGTAKNGSMGTGGAWDMTTEERVAKFGNEKLLAQYRAYKYTPELGLDVFAREFEMLVLDDRESYYPLSLIKDCYELAGRDYWFKSVDVDGSKYGRFNDCLTEAKRAIDRLSSEIRLKTFSGEWGFSMDVGREHDRDEIWVGHNLPKDRERLLPRLNIGMHKMPFDGKEDILHYLFSKIPISRGYLDATHGSMGVQLSERMFRRYGSRCAPFEFSNSSKQIIASGLKAKMESGKMAIPPKTSKFGKLENQMVRIKKLISPSGNVIFDVERNKKAGHGDCFWSLAMLCELYTKPAVWMPRRPVVMEQNNRSQNSGRDLRR